jgi:hypothetical protein
MTRRIFITGASSGIGEHLAYAYAQPGALLGLAARRLDRLQQVAEQCRARGAQTLVYEWDVRDQPRGLDIARRYLDETGGIDLVIANAGIGGEDRLASGDSTAINRILTTNILGVTNTVVPFIPTLQEQRSGTVVIISSVAGFRGLPGHGGYNGSKAAVRVIADAWRLTLHRYSIRVVTICPGFLETPLVSKNRFPMPFLMPVERAAEKIVAAVARGKRTYIFPWQWRLVVPLLKILPDWIIQTFSPYRPL